MISQETMKRMRANFDAIARNRREREAWTDEQVREWHLTIKADVDAGRDERALEWAAYLEAEAAALEVDGAACRSAEARIREQCAQRRAEEGMTE